MLKETFCAMLIALSSLYHQSIEFIKPKYEQTVQMVKRYINQTKLCGVCKGEMSKDEQDIIATGCNGDFHVCHTNCMKKWVEQNRFDCPTCNVQLSSTDIDHVLSILNDGDADPATIETVECSICLDSCDGVWPYKVTLHCTHGEHNFHADCLYDATQHNLNSCPNCRSDINDEDMQMLKDAYQFKHSEL
ncbi:MAG: RING finger domain-containing protein [Candidatus Dependentiae bacterium]